MFYFNSYFTVFRPMCENSFSSGSQYDCNYVIISPKAVLFSLSGWLIDLLIAGLYKIYRMDFNEPCWKDGKRAKKEPITC